MKRVVLIVCVVVALVMVVVLVWRPGARGSDETSTDPGWLGGLGLLLPDAAVQPDDVAGRPCWNDGVLTVAPGGACATRLPDGRRVLRLCVEEGLPQARVTGSRFGSQPVRGLVPCGAGQEATEVDLYDEGSVLHTLCFGTAACRLRLV